MFSVTRTRAKNPAPVMTMPKNATLQPGQGKDTGEGCPRPAELINHWVEEGAESVEDGTDTQAIKEATGSDNPPTIEDIISFCLKLFDNIHCGQVNSYYTKLLTIIVANCSIPQLRLASEPG